MREGLVDVRGRVRKEEYDYFKTTFPQNGSVQWFISTAFVVFNQRIRENPELKADVDAAIHSMLELSHAIAKSGDVDEAGE